MKYPILLFDADNTLFDYDAAETAALKNTFAAYDIEDTLKTRAVYKKYNDKLWKALEEQKVTKDALKVIRFEQLLDELQVEADPNAMSHTYTLELGKGTQLLEGAKELVEHLAENHQMYILTNGIHEVQQSRIGNSSIAQHMQKIYTSEGIGFTKPDKAFFEHVFTDLKITDRSKVLMIGDSLSADIKGANNAGIDSCWYNLHAEENTTNILPTYDAKNFAELKEIIR